MNDYFSPQQIAYIKAYEAKCSIRYPYEQFAGRANGFELAVIYFLVTSEMHSAILRHKIRTIEDACNHVGRQCKNWYEEDGQYTTELRKEDKQLFGIMTDISANLIDYCVQDHPEVERLRLILLEGERWQVRCTKEAEDYVVKCRHEYMTARKIHKVD